jgi:hypothetical protein
VATAARLPRQCSTPAPTRGRSARPLARFTPAASTRAAVSTLATRLPVLVQTSGAHFGRHRTERTAALVWQGSAAARLLCHASERRLRPDRTHAPAWRQASDPTPPALRSPPRPAQSLARDRFAEKRASGTRPRRVARRSRYRPEGSAPAGAARRSLSTASGVRPGRGGVIAMPRTQSPAAGRPGRVQRRRRDRPRQTRSVSAPAIAFVRARARALGRPATGSHSIPSVRRAFSRLLPVVHCGSGQSRRRETSAPVLRMQPPTAPTLAEHAPRPPWASAAWRGSAFALRGRRGKHRLGARSLGRARPASGRDLDAR